MDPIFAVGGDHHVEVPNYFGHNETQLGISQASMGSLVMVTAHCANAEDALTSFRGKFVGRPRKVKKRIYYRYQNVSRQAIFRA